jgi:DNA-binding MarR family transcriptional regulator
MLDMHTTSAASDSLGFLLNDAARLLRRRFDHKARSLGLTRAQWQVLARLARHEGINQVGLADLLELEPITLCRLIDRMEEGGWVVRQRDPADRRAHRLYMTDKAHPVIARMWALAEEVYAEALAGIPVESRQQFLATLANIRTNLLERSDEAGSLASAS